MKRMVFLGLFVILQVFAFSGFNEGNGNSVLYAQSNDAQRIVGTWVGIDRDGDEIDIVFNSNGTVTGDYTGRYFLSNSILFIRTSRRAYVIPYHFSPDGRIIVLTSGGNYTPYWLEKQ